MYLGPYVLVKTLSRPPNDQAALTGPSELCMPVPSRVCLHVAYVCPFENDRRPSSTIQGAYRMPVQSHAIICHTGTTSHCLPQIS